MKKMLGLSLAILIPGVCVAAHDGPFANLSALITYWNGTPTGGSLTQIYLDGTKVFQESGFGPAYVHQYFECPQTGDIRTDCLVGDIVSSDEDYADQVAKFPPGTTIYLDGVLKRSAPPPRIAYLLKCAGDASYYAPGWVIYYATEAYYDGFGPPYTSGSC